MTIGNEMQMSEHSRKVLEAARFIKSKDGTLSRVVVIPISASMDPITSDERMMLDMSDHIEYLELMLTAAGVDFRPYGLPPRPVNVNEPQGDTECR